MNTGFEDAQNDEFWLDGLRTIMLQCDALVLDGNWKQSVGCRLEHEAWLIRFGRGGRPIFDWTDNPAKSTAETLAFIKKQ